ncbi:TIGR03621 family F420-dependent LLM class oxidoreductase [Amycolatopsis eburnea]|uniref:TIGR03621 family F420-dependent LLM class oxidoreductase n=1 Tax=Amycolatopsis eburnea TaxID=2267691 RepID=A0A3R9ESC9_9PSEU|nr:TIGR03621 family F420-dependent LLM class oxidoreductase [Amycolatopsis eburnea]RSD19988.1 TIGR03621 family F420-dependent LLM class oxidoreductase [Amycolatopsis eburnea]
MTGEFRFGVNLIVPDSRAAWVEKCRKVEDLGYDVLSAADHLGMAPPFPALVLAGEVTSRVKLNTFVLNTPFYNPVLLARDVTGTDQFTDGRLELGLGAGYVKAEFEAAGMPFPSARERVDHLERTILELKRLYADPEHKPSPTRPEGPPLLLAGRGDRILTLAAEHADTIGFTGTAKSPDGAELVPASAADIEERVEFVRGKLGGRKAEFNLLCHFVHITEDRAGALEELAKRTKGALSADQLAEVPTALIGSPAQVAEQLHAHRERFGLTYYTVLEHNLAQFAPVLEALR